MSELFRCRITCRDFDTVHDMLSSLTRVTVGNDNYSVEERFINVTCLEDDLDALRQVVARFDRHARLEIWRPKGEAPAISFPKELPPEALMTDLVGYELPKNFLGHPFIKAQGKRPEA